MRSASNAKVKDQSKQTYERESGDGDAGNEKTAISYATPSVRAVKKEQGRVPDVSHHDKENKTFCVKAQK